MKKIDRKTQKKIDEHLKLLDKKLREAALFLKQINIDFVDSKDILVIANDTTSDSFYFMVDKIKELGLRMEMRKSILCIVK